MLPLPKIWFLFLVGLRSRSSMPSSAVAAANVGGTSTGSDDPLSGFHVDAIDDDTVDDRGTANNEASTTIAGERQFETQLILTHRVHCTDQHKRLLPPEWTGTTELLLVSAKSKDWIPVQDIAQMESLLLDTLNHHHKASQLWQEVPRPPASRSRLVSVHAQPQGLLRLPPEQENPTTSRDKEVVVELEMTYTIRGICGGPSCSGPVPEEHHDILRTAGFLPSRGPSHHQSMPPETKSGRGLRGQGQPLEEEQLTSSETNSMGGYQELREAMLQRAQLLLSRQHQQHSDHATQKGESCGGYNDSCLQKKKKRSTWDLLQDITSIRPSKRTHRNLQNEEDDLIHVVEVVCDPLVQQLETAVAIDLSGDWSALIQSNRTLATADVNVTMTASALLEGAFVEAFNHIIFPLCDWPHFRKVWGAEPQTAAFDPFGNVTTVTFEVLAECRNCGYDTPLFHSSNDTTTTGSVLIPLSTSTVRTRPSSLVRQEFGLTNDGCLCPRPDDTTEFRAPTFDEFMEAFMLEVAKIQLPPVDDMELQEVPCASDVTEFTTYVYIDFQMNRSSDFQTLSEQDQTVLENSFKSLYNQLSFQSCDPYFRSVSEAQLELNTDTALVRRRLQQQLDLNLAFAGNSTNTSNYNQTGTAPPHHNPNQTSTPLLRATTGVAVLHVSAPQKING
ncbi:expressed unknown protein [Seminavis robusta]|uniref:Uncharacterized protein n=1 Tax=Seminavis robusta TaxID=568900 RepID=A0A9N8HN07_9STRA|nr:expressed unknown protein [Seminavis robusta]|eukprot:Sro1044_g234880.1 n/a (673) ;mRNA; f:5185-7360